MEMPDYLKAMLPPDPPKPTPTVVADDSIPEYLRGYFVAEPAVDHTTQPVFKSWSFSDWSVFKECPYVLYARRILKKNGGAESEANIRGNAVHAFLEHSMEYMDIFPGTALDLLPRLTKDEDLLDLLEGFTAKDVPKKAWRALDSALEKMGGTVIEPEAKIYLDKDWVVCHKDKRWLTAIIDGLAIDHVNKKILILDWKTGQKHSVKHTQQGSLYAAVMHRLYPNYEIEVRFVYVDDETIPDLVLEYRPDSKKLARLMEFWRDEGKKFTTAVKSDFAPFYNPDRLVSVPPYHLPFLRDVQNYDAAHFPPPVYAK